MYPFRKVPFLSFEDFMKQISNLVCVSEWAWLSDSMFRQESHSWLRPCVWPSRMWHIRGQFPAHSPSIEKITLFYIAYINNRRSEYKWWMCSYLSIIVVRLECPESRIDHLWLLCTSAWRSLPRPLLNPYCKERVVRYMYCKVYVLQGYWCNLFSFRQVCIIPMKLFSLFMLY